MRHNINMPEAKVKIFLLYLLLCSCGLGSNLLYAAPFPAANPNSDSNASSKTKKESKGRDNFQKALQALGQGKLKRARLFVRLSRKNEFPKGFQNDPKNKRGLALLRLEALLSLFLEGFHQAGPKLINAFEKEPRAGLAYFLGNYFLRLAYFTKASYYFEKAAQLFEQGQKQKQSKKIAPIPSKLNSASISASTSTSVAASLLMGKEKDETSDLAYALAPSLCIQDLKELGKYEAKSWNYIRKRKAASWLWELISQALSPEQAALSLYQAYTFAPRRRKKLALLLQNSSHVSLPSGLSALLLNPHSEANHGKCILGLKKIHSELLYKIKKGAPFQAKRQREFVEQHLLDTYHKQVLLLNNSKAAYSYGAYLLEKGKALAALHVLRQALKLLGSNLYGFKNDKNKLLELQQILYALHSVYKEGLKREQDAQALRKILKIIEEYFEEYFKEDTEGHSFSSALPNASKASQSSSAWLTRIHHSCQSSLYNREALVFLLAHAKHEASPKHSFYQRKLIQRDKDFAEKELSSGYRRLQIGSQEPD